MGAKRKAVETKQKVRPVARKAAKLTKVAAPKKDPAIVREEEIAKLILDHRENGRKLSRSILRRWRVRMPSEEIDSIVDLALCEAARRYSSTHGASFMTFFFYHLRGHLVRSVARAAQGSNVFLAFARSAGLENPEWSQNTVEAACAYMPDYIVNSQRDQESPENVMIRQEKISQCQTACSQLDTLEREILDRSYAEEQPLVDIAKSLGYSRCHISRVKKSALDRLKAILASSPEPVVEVEVETRKSTNKRANRVTPIERAKTLRRTRRRNVGRGRVRIEDETKAA